MNHSTRPRARGVKRVRVNPQGLAKGGDGAFVVPGAEISVAKIHVKGREIIAQTKGPLVSAYGLAVLLPLVPDGANIIVRVGVMGVQLCGLLVAPESGTQFDLIVKADAEFIPVNGVSGLLLGQLVEQVLGFVVLLADKVKPGHVFLGQFWGLCARNRCGRL